MFAILECGLSRKLGRDVRLGRYLTLSHVIWHRGVYALPSLGRYRLPGLHTLVDFNRDDKLDDKSPALLHIRAQ
jgi:hypothetical protein